MAHFLTNEEIKEILKDPCPPTLLGFGGYTYAHKVDIYTFYLYDKFGKIDKKYHLKKQRNDNKGLKGELLMCGIIDLTMWRFGFRLGQDYTVTHAKKKKKEVDFKLTCLDTLFLCEAKNWNIGSYVTKKNYREEIKTRFSCDGVNILMILRNKIPAIQKMYKKYSTDNGKPINYLQISNFMDVKWNDIDYVNVNLMLGVNQMLSFVLREQGIIGRKRRKIIEHKEIGGDFSLEECLQMEMPNWFIYKYLDKSEKTVNRKAKSLGLNRKSSAYKSLTKYRNIKGY